MSDVDGWMGTRDQRDPPVPVWIDLRRVFPPRSIGVRHGTPMRVRAGGIDIAREVPGELLAWQLTITGDRWAHVRLELANRSKRGRVQTEAWVAEDAVRRREL